MSLTMVSPPAQIIKIYKSIIWNNVRDNIILTFDDGPNPGSTVEILKVLKNYKIKAIFFLLGKNIKGNQDLVERIVAAEHFVANHSYSHYKLLPFSGKKRIISEISMTEKLLINYKNKLNLFRPPYGYFNNWMIDNVKFCNLKMMLWTLLTEDYLCDEEIVIKNLNKHLEPNSILVLHDNDKTKKNIVKILDESINFILKRGQNFEQLFSF